MKRRTTKMTAGEWIASAEVKGHVATRQADGCDYEVTVPKGELRVIYELTGDGDGSIKVVGEGDGAARRDGAGDGDAVRCGAGKGGARRGGDGEGDAWRDGDGKGNAWRCGDGDI